MVLRLLIAVVITGLLAPMVYAGTVACACCSAEPVAVETESVGCCGDSESKSQAEHPAPSGPMPHFCTCEAGSPPHPTPLATVTSAPRIDTGKAQTFLHVGHRLTGSSVSISPVRFAEIPEETASPPASYVVNCAFLR